MKKIILFLTLMFTIFCLTACDPSSYYYSFEKMKNEVEKIQLIDYDNPNAKTLFEKRDEVLSFDFEKMEVIETLSIEQHEDFLQNFSQIHFLEYWKHSDSPSGLSIRIVYKNGDFEIISYEVIYAGSFYAEGNVKEFIGGLSGNASFVTIINKFFNKKIS